MVGLQFQEARAKETQKHNFQPDYRREVLERARKLGEKIRRWRLR